MSTFYVVIFALNWTNIYIYVPDLVLKALKTLNAFPKEIYRVKIILFCLLKIVI